MNAYNQSGGQTVSEQEFTENIVTASYNHRGSGQGCIIFPGCSNCGGAFIMLRGEIVEACCDAPTSSTLEAMRASTREIRQGEP